MLTSLRIRNLALVEDLLWAPSPGYTAITGETGAGKSIILGALKLIIGERADKTLIRSGADACTVEATFSLSDLENWNRRLEENGAEPCEDDQLLLKRTFSANGSNRQFINGSPTTLAVLKTLTEDLVDLHGPHDHQSLFAVSRQLEIVDQFAQNRTITDKYQTAHQHFRALQEEYDTLATSETAAAQEIELLEFQKDEIASAQLQIEAELETETRYAAIANSRRLIELGAGIQDRLSEAEESAAARHTEAQRLFRELERLDPSPAVAEIGARHTALVAELDDLVSTLGQYLENLDLDPAQIQLLEDRVNLLEGLKRKYGRTVEEIIAFGENAAARLAKITGREAELATLQLALEKAENERRTVGGQLTRTRQKALPLLAKDVASQLQQLGFRQSQFEIAVHPLATPRTTGFEDIEFQFAPNPGEPLKPLRAIASSGEISRLMLAIKSALARQDHVPLLVFDEVDANIGGEIAHAVGEKMRSLGEHHQVLTITHLPQVAARAAGQFVVAKEVENGRTVSTLTEVTGKNRIAEIARMLGGQSKSATEHATALLEG